MGYKYETHCHTFPVSRCAVCGVEDTLKFYKDLGFDGVFITNHFIDSNINIQYEKNYEDKVNFYFSDYERALNLSEKIGIKVFLGVESTYACADFLVYGLDKDWFINNEDKVKLKAKERLKAFMDAGALVIQAHPFREASYIDYIKLFPRSVHGVEIFNANNLDEQNRLAKIMADSYNLKYFGGSDNHSAGITQKYISGIEFDKPINSEKEFVDLILHGKYEVLKVKIK